MAKRLRRLRHTTDFELSTEDWEKIGVGFTWFQDESKQRFTPLPIDWRLISLGRFHPRLLVTHLCIIHPCDLGIEFLRLSALVHCHPPFPAETGIVAQKLREAKVAIDLFPSRRTAHLAELEELWKDLNGVWRNMPREILLLIASYIPVQYLPEIPPEWRIISHVKDFLDVALQ